MKIDTLLTNKYFKWFMLCYPQASIWDDIEEMFWWKFRDKKAMEWLDKNGQQAERNFLTHCNAKKLYSVAMITTKGDASHAVRVLAEECAQLMGWNK